MIVVLLLVAAQQWDSPDALSLVERAVQRRRQAETGVTKYTAKANGVVLFLAQLGAGTNPPSRLIKADQLAVEVYWEAPNRSKQIVTAWRERRFLPTDINYHRDHLGVVTDDFGDTIRLGEGDEVLNVPHPLGPEGPASYQYALGDSLRVSRGAELLTVREILVRPREPSLPRVAGSLFVDARSADLVRARFSFTAAAYVQPELEDITVVLERALFEQRYWLPWRQEIEIRRRTAWLAFPFRTIIRGRWDVGDYDLAASFPSAQLLSGPYGGLRQARPDTGWTEPLDSAIARAGGSVARADLVETRQLVSQLVSETARATQPPARLALGSVSDLARVNRVEGLALGIGARLRLGGPDLTIAPRLGYGFSSEQVTGGATVSVRAAPLTLSIDATRAVRDLSDWPTISGVVNSITAQEGGNDYGDWVMLDRLMFGLKWQAGTVTAWTEAGTETSHSLEAGAAPASGEYRLNPPLGDGSVWTARLGVESEWRNGLERNLTIGGQVEAGAFDRGYLRVTTQASARVPAGPGALDLNARGGWTSGTAPVWRTFVLGGRGTLPGEPYRAYGGSHMAWAHVEWRFPVRIPTPRVGNWIEAGSTATLAPFAAVGWSDAPEPGLPWGATAGVRPVLGVASELLFNVLRVELGWALREGRVAVLLDASPSWWPIL